MPRIKRATDASGITFYPATILKAVWDIDRNQRLSATINDLYNSVSPAYATDAECIAAADALT